MFKPVPGSLKAYYKLTNTHLKRMVKYYSAYIWLLFYIDSSNRKDDVFHTKMMECIEKMKICIDEYGKLNHLIKSSNSNIILKRPDVITLMTLGGDSDENQTQISENRYNIENQENQFNLANAN